MRGGLVGEVSFVGDESLGLDFTGLEGGVQGRAGGRVLDGDLDLGGELLGR